MIKVAGLWYDFQLQPPGTLGIADSASPDNLRLSLSTPGPTGINDPTVGLVDNPAEVLLGRIEESEMDLEYAQMQLLLLIAMDKPPADLGNKWLEVHECFRRHYELLEDYIKNFYKASDKTPYQRSLVRYNDFNQSVGYDSDPCDVTVLSAIVDIQTLILNKAYEYYLAYPTRETLARVLVLATETKNYTDQVDVELPPEIAELVAREAVKRANRTPEEAYAEWLWLLTRDVPPADPIKLDWIRYKNTGI